MPAAGGQLRAAPPARRRGARRHRLAPGGPVCGLKWKERLGCQRFEATPQSGCIRQAQEQRWRDGQLHNKTPVVARDPGQQVPVADDKAVALMDRDGPGAPEGIAHPAGRGKSIDKAEPFGQGDGGVDRLPQHAHGRRGRHDRTVNQLPRPGSRTPGNSHCRLVTERVS
jgi:hypothetical protein